MFGQRPGTIEKRNLTLKDEVLRIVVCGSLAILLALIVIWTLFFEAMVLGPLMGCVIGAALIFYLMIGKVAPLVYDVDPEHYRSYTLAMLVLGLFAWGTIGYQISDLIWPPRLPWALPAWAVVMITFSLTIIQGVCVGMCYLLASEAFDPNGPTPTRKPIEHPHSIFPWTKVQEDVISIEQPTHAPRLVRIHHERENEKGQARNRDLLLPDTAAWRQYARAISNRVAKFSEASAKGFGISPQDKHDRSTHQVTEIGFRSVRDLLKVRGYIALANEQAPNMGYRFEDDFWELMDEFGTEPD